MTGLQFSEPSDLIGLIRIAPLIVVLYFACNRRRPFLALHASAFILSVIFNQYFENRFVGGIFGTLSAYMLLMVTVNYVMQHGKVKR